MRDKETDQRDDSPGDVSFLNSEERAALIALWALSLDERERVKAFFCSGCHRLTSGRCYCERDD